MKDVRLVFVKALPSMSVRGVKRLFTAGQIIRNCIGGLATKLIVQQKKSKRKWQRR